MTKTVHIVSFGFGHTGTVGTDGTPLAPPQADIQLDLRHLLLNPFFNAALRTRTGLDPDVYAYVLDTPGAQSMAMQTALAVNVMMVDGDFEQLTVSAGCTGGRHRAVGIARRIHEHLTVDAHEVGYTVTLTHRDVHRPLLPPRTHTTKRRPAP